MKKMSLDEYKALLKEMLKDFHSLCVRNDLKYFTAYGTLIGTVRHDGFIPWDDDLDVCMPRDDYEKLIRIVEGADLPYYMLTSSNSKNYYNTFARFCSRKGILRHKVIVDIENIGPYIDIFPLDKVPENREERLAHYEEVGKYQKLLKYSLPLRLLCKLRLRRKINMLILHRAVRKAALKAGTLALKKKRDELLVRYNDTESGVLFPEFDTMTDDLIVMADEIEPLQLHAFEGFKVYIPAGYDAILRRYYGDYMELPPEQERVPKHHFTAYWK